MHTILNTLYITTPQAYAHLDNNTVRIEVERETRLRVPLHHLEGIVCFGNVLVSPALMHRLAEEGKNLVLLDELGQFKARIEGPVSGNVLLRQALYRLADRSETVREWARVIVAGKIKNSRTVLMRGARESQVNDEARMLSQIADSLASSLRAVKAATSVDELRGIEGEAARKYFTGLNLIVKPAFRKTFHFNGRTRRPPLDRFNALISFFYALLMNDCRSALETVGLDPQLGFLHAVRPGRAALALDLQEEFRAILADRMALTLINRAQIQADDFEEREGGAVMLNDRGRRVSLTAWQERKKEIVTHPLLEQKLPIALLPLVQARLMARAMRGEMESYIPYLAR